MIEYAYSQNLAFPDKNIDFSVTLITNLVGISKEKLDIYGDLVGGHQKKYGPEKFLLATSYEPDTKRFNDKTLKDWESNISYLRGRGVTIACGITGTQGTIDMGVSGILEYLHKGLGLIPHYDHFALFGEGRNRKDLMPSYKEIEDFITEFFLKTRDMDAFSEFFDYSEPYALENLNSRWHSAIAVNFDGIVSMDSESSADDQFDSVAKKQKMFNIQEIRIIRQLMEANKRRILDMEKDVFRNSKCLSCEFSTFCKGGFRHYIDVFDGKGECAGFYNFIKNVFGDKL
jgi:radical SAM protein with 4Fe4S-binding SPASM domain